MEKNYRHRMIMLLTRTRLLYPAKYKRDELNELIERPYTDEYEDDIERYEATSWNFFIQLQFFVFLLS